jgi:hypothetical protein
MRLPRIHGVIRRRLLVNFRIDPEVAQRQLPSPFRPKLHAGYAVGGICLIRLEHIRPKRFPKLLGMSSENAAHRFAVTWSDEHGEREGVYIPRRDSGSLMNRIAGGRVFPGEHHRAHFDVIDTGNQVSITMTASDLSLRVDAAAARELAADSIFRSTEEASRFFEPGSLGFSATGTNRLDGVQLQTKRWEVQPLRIASVASSYFDDETRFPKGSIAFDCALIMRDIEHEWVAADDLVS